MKISSKIYAQALIESLEQESDLSNIAGNFLTILEKNKQKKKLLEILDLLEDEYARSKNSIFAKIYSSHALSLEKVEIIEQKLEKSTGKKIMSKNVIKNECMAGITVEIEGKLYDYSLAGTIDSFKKQLLK